MVKPGFTAPPTAPNRRTGLGRHWAISTGGVLLILLFVVALLAPILAPSDPLAVQPAAAKLPPTFAHILGTDFAGRDVFSRLLYSLRLAYAGGMLAVSITAVFGLALGLWAGYHAGRVDAVMMWLMDLWLVIPEILFILVIIALLGRDTWQILMAVGLAGIPSYVRFVRLLTIHEKSQLYVDAARVIGASTVRITFNHILRNIWPMLFTRLSIRFGYAILAAGALSFIGISAQPATPELGSLLKDGQESMRYAWWLLIGPLAVLWLTMLAANLISDAVAEQD
jgi:ABC-type dipeptide/oligopeptide/nickel transport system permease subunit